MEKHNRRSFLFKLAAVPAIAVTGSLAPFKLFANPNSSVKNTSAMSNSDQGYIPSYVALQQSGVLKERGDVLFDEMRHCRLCPRNCETDRISGKRGDCRANADLEISSASPHFGEERELVGQNGSGTVFFTHCSMECVFCINYEVSQMGHGQKYSIRDLSNMMLLLQRHGCHNINLVSPTHYLPHILLALDRASAAGLRLPVAYNTSGWEKTEMLEFLDGVVDIYLTDFKYADHDAAATYSPGSGNYPDIAQKALLEMHRQTGVAKPDPKTNLIYRGLMIRHLVMPGNVARTDRVLRWIAANLPDDTYVNIMSQYTPMHKAHDFPEISRRINRSEYNNAVTIARNAGLTNLRLQMR